MKLSQVLLVGATAGLMFGCQSSTHDIPLGKQQLVIDAPITLPRNSMPIAISSDGKRIALISGVGGAVGELSVIDTDSLAILGTRKVAKDTGGTPMFSADGTRLCIGLEEGYVAWSYADGAIEKLPGTPHASPWPVGWNYDRSIVIGLTSKSQGSHLEIDLPLGVVHRIPNDSHPGFDQFGNAWFRKGSSWTEIERSGRMSNDHVTHPGLVVDQTMDRGSRLLRATDQEMRYQGAEAHVTCVWLTDDRATPAPLKKLEPNTTRVENSFHRAALVYTGADVYAYGFVPHHDLIYVVSGQGCFLVPFKVEENPNR